MKHNPIPGSGLFPVVSKHIIPFFQTIQQTSQCPHILSRTILLIQEHHILLLRQFIFHRIKARHSRRIAGRKQVLRSRTKKRRSRSKGGKIGFRHRHIRNAYIIPYSGTLIVFHQNPVIPVTSRLCHPDSALHRIRDFGLSPIFRASAPKRIPLRSILRPLQEPSSCRRRRVFLPEYSGNTEITNSLLGLKVHTPPGRHSRSTPIATIGSNIFPLIIPVCDTVHISSGGFRSVGCIGKGTVCSDQVIFRRQCPEKRRGKTVFRNPVSHIKRSSGHIYHF